jgi:hypothetical protein
MPRTIRGELYHTDFETGLVQWENGVVTREELPPKLPYWTTDKVWKALFDTKTKKLFFCASVK